MEKLEARFHETLFDDMLSNGSIYPAFQPIIDLKTGAVAGFEVLARWNDKEFGEIPPIDFIPLVEKFGLLSRLSCHLIRQACKAAVSWQGPVALAFNISPAQFQAAGLPQLIAAAAQESSFPLSQLRIEITETAIIMDEAEALAAINELKMLGIQIYLDDFGTGFSSLTRLRSLPFDMLKVDASFVGTMLTSRDSRKIVSSIVGLGHSLGMPVIAEGVETKIEVDLLTKLGCDFGQGFYFGRPTRAEYVPGMLDALGAQTREPGPLDLSCNIKIAQLETLYATAPIGLCFIDRAARLANANALYCELMSVKLESILGVSVYESFPAEAANFEEEMTTLLTGGYVKPMRILLPDQRRAATLTPAPVFDEAGDVLGLFCALTDVKEYDGVTPIKAGTLSGARPLLDI
jgi:EAL domain-containing protein (putative c-di-GMP-specific phosphodiesterase class I)